MSANAATIELSRPLIAEPRYERPVPLLSTDRPDARIVEFAEGCEELLRLPAGWNSYRAAPIDGSLLHEGIRVLSFLVRPGVRMPEVVPTVHGGVQIEWHRHDRDLEIEIRGLGHYLVYMRHNDREEEFEIFDDIARLEPHVRFFSI